MPYLSLYRKYRPQNFDEILGQEHVSTTLKNAIAEDRVAHAYLFTGPRGTGKTSTARILAKALNCEKGPTPEPCGVCPSCIAITEGSSLDVIEMDAASHSGVEDTRDILSGVALATAGGKRKVYVIDEIHMLSTPAFNALLKTLEEPPPHVIFIFATTEAHKVPPTIVSRTQRFDFRRISAESLEKHLTDIAAREGTKTEPDALAALARYAEGSARDALSALDQLSSLGSVSFDDVQRMLGGRDEDLLIGLFDAIAAGEVGSVFSSLQAFVAQGSDLRRLALATMDHARGLLLLKTAPQAEAMLDVAPEDARRMAAQADSFSAPGLLRTLDLIGKAMVEMRNVPNHRLLLEVALARAASPETDPSSGGLLGRIERLERRMGIEEAAPAPQPPAQLAQAPAQPTPAPKPETPTGAPRMSPTPAAPAPAEVTAAPVETPIATPSGELALAHFVESWDVIRKEVDKISRRVGAYLNPSRPVAYENGTLTIEVQAEYHAGELGDVKNKGVLVSAVNAALGVSPDLVFVERSRQPAAPAAVVEDEEVAVDELEDSAEDPIEIVKRGLGGEVVDHIEAGRDGGGKRS